MNWQQFAGRWRVRAWLARARLRGYLSRRANPLLTVAGLAGMLGGSALIGVWCLGLVLIAESAGAVAVGLLRDDGRERPQVSPQALTVEDILERERARP